MSYSAGSSEEDLPDKHKGERRWLGKHHHKGKDGMARQLRDRATIQKTLVDKDNTLSKKAKERLMDGCKDNMELNVAYSLNKKNRWETADPVELLKKAPDSVDAAVVQRGVRISVMNIYLGAEKTTAVHERVNNDGNGEFDVRTAKCIGAGQELSNFAEESREKSTKKARRKNKEGDEPQEINKPAIHYDVIEADRNPDIIAGHFFSNARRGKIGGKLRSRGRNELVEELYQQRFSVSDNDVGDYDDDDDVSEDDHVRSSISLSDYVIEKKKQQRQRRRRRSASVDLAEYEVVDSEPTTFKELVDIAPAMKSGHVFVNFKNQMGPNFKLDDEIEGLKSDETLEVRKIDQRRYSINATRAIRTFSETYPNSYLIVVVEELKNKQVSFIVNSSIPGNPYTVGPQDMYQRVSNANGLREVLNRFIEFFSSSFEIHRRIHCVAMAENVPLSIKERDPVEWENAKEAVKSTLVSYYSYFFGHKCL